MTITKSGELASFYTVNKAPIKHLRVYFSPKQVGEGDPSPENIRPIEGWNEINIWQAGKNLLSEKYILSPAQMNSTEDGYAILPANVYKILTINVPKNIELHLSKLVIGGSDLGLGNEIATIGTPVNRVGSMTNYYHRTFNSGDNQYVYLMVGKNNQINDPNYQWQLELGNKRTEYELPKPILEQQVSFPESIYGGYVDLASGEVCATYKMVDLSDLNWSYGSNRCRTLDLSSSIKTSSSYSSLAPLIGEQVIAGRMSMDLSNFPNTIACNSSGTLIKYYDGDLPQGKIVYELAEPIIYQLTPLQLSTLIGQNNIWSNADRVEVEYDLAESNDELYRRRNILLRTPHIETAAGSIASFKTDMQAQLKECKIYFEPVQEGSGDPSPENVRAISGWTGIEVTRCGKNLYNPDSAWLKNGRLFKRFINHTECCTSFTVKDDSLTNNVYFGYAYTPENIELGYNWMIENGVISSRSKVNRARSSSLTNPEGANALCDYFTIYPGTDARINQLNAKWQIQTELGTTPTEYEPYQGQTLTLDWTDEAGTIYGGYIDLIKGKLIQEWDKKTFNEMSWNYQTYNNSNVFISNTLKGICLKSASPDNLKCNKFKPVTGSGSAASFANYANYTIAQYTPSDNHQIYVKDSNYTVVSDFLTEHGDTILVYKLATPIEYNIDPQILKTLRGTNNIWSNTNGPIEIKYWTH